MQAGICRHSCLSSSGTANGATEELRDDEIGDRVCAVTSSDDSLLLTVVQVVFPSLWVAPLSEGGITVARDKCLSVSAPIVTLFFPFEMVMDKLEGEEAAGTFTEALSPTTDPVRLCLLASASSITSSAQEECTSCESACTSTVRALGGTSFRITRSLGSPERFGGESSCRPEITLA